MDWQSEATAHLSRVLEKWLRAPVMAGPGPGDVDLALQVGGRRVLVEVKGSDDIPTLSRAADRLARHARAKDLALVVVPYMGPGAQQWAAEHKVSWVDLSGNADVVDDGLFVTISGKKNRFASRGRPSNPFTPRYSRVSRALLADPYQWWRQVDLAATVHLPQGTVSKVVRQLHELGLLERNEQNALRAKSESALFESWRQRYRFTDHTLHRYHLAVRSGEAGLRRLSDELRKAQVKYAATGLSAAWLYTRHADFRLNTFYVMRPPNDPEALGLRPVESGENVWLVVPNDLTGVLYKLDPDKDGVRCVHPVQVLLDLVFQPERAPEAAESVRELLKWRV